LTGLGSELVARMSGGLVCGVQHADEETRREILRQFTETRSLDIPQSVLNLISAELPGDARQLSGALNRLHASSLASQQPISMANAESALTDVFQNARRTIHMTDIETAVCDIFGLESKALRSNKKTNAITHPRMLAMWLARRYTRAAYSEIGQYFGQRSHSTVISAQKKVKTWVDDGAQIRLAGGDCKVEDAIKRVELRLRTG
jgi:chromosomal replication initiator protein